MPATDVASELRRTLRGDPLVAAAWLFGSASRDALREDSDVDVALILRNPEDSAASRRRELADLAARCEARLGRPIDVVVLGLHDPVIAHRVLSEGTLLVDDDRARRVQFTTDVVARYLDWAPLYEAAAARSLAVNRAWARGQR